MIVARHFGGFGALAAMTWAEYAAARQYLAEERLGARVREAALAEDAAVAAASKALSR